MSVDVQLICTCIWDQLSKKVVRHQQSGKNDDWRLIFERNVSLKGAKWAKYIESTLLHNNIKDKAPRSPGPRLQPLGKGLFFCSDAKCFPLQPDFIEMNKPKQSVNISPVCSVDSRLGYVSVSSEKWDKPVYELSN